MKETREASEEKLFILDLLKLNKSEKMYSEETVINIIKQVLKLLQSQEQDNSHTSDVLKQGTQSAGEILKKHNIFQDASNDAIGMLILRAMEEYSSQKQSVVLPSDEIKDAIEFILENGDRDDYVCENISHFLNERNDPDDDSCRLEKYWNDQLEILELYLRKLINKPK